MRGKMSTYQLSDYLFSACKLCPKMQSEAQRGDKVLVVRLAALVKILFQEFSYGDYWQNHA